MAEERRKGDEDEDADGDQPTGGEVADLLGPWPQLLFDDVSAPRPPATNAPNSGGQRTSTTWSCLTAIKTVMTTRKMPTRCQAVARFRQSRPIPRFQGRLRPPTTPRGDVRIYLGAKKKRFQLMGLYSVSSNSSACLSRRPRCDSTSSFRAMWTFPPRSGTVGGGERRAE